MTQTTLPEIQITHHARATRLRLRVEPTQIRLTVMLPHMLKSFLWNMMNRLA